MPICAPFCSPSTQLLPQPMRLQLPSNDIHDAGNINLYSIYFWWYRNQQQVIKIELYLNAAGWINPRPLSQIWTKQVAAGKSNSLKMNELQKWFRLKARARNPNKAPLENWTGPTRGKEEGKRRYDEYCMMGESWVGDWVVEIAPDAVGQPTRSLLCQPLVSDYRTFNGGSSLFPFARSLRIDC